MMKPKPLTPEHLHQLLATLERLIDRWANRGYCPHCLARVLLLHSGLLAEQELEQDEMREALSYLADLNVPSQGVRH